MLGFSLACALQADWVRDHVTFGGQVRARVEIKDPVDYRLPGTFGRPASERRDRSDEWAISRLRLNADVGITEQVHVFLEGQDAHIFGRNAAAVGPLPTSNVSLRQAYLDLRKLGGVFSFRIGRQELLYGDQRVVSTLDWTHLARAWDAFRLRIEPEKWRFDLFASAVNEGASKFRADGVRIPRRFFHGGYFTYLGIENHEFDAYALYRDFDRRRATQLTEWTLGARANGKSGPWDYSGEAAFQRGLNGRAATNRRIAAWGAAVTGGHTFEAAVKPRVGFEYTFATGDAQTTDRAFGTFRPPFAFGHAYQGYADVFAWQNGHALTGKLSLKPHEQWSLNADVHGFWLDRRRDAWFNAGGGVIRRDAAPATGRARHVGVELDLHARWKPHERVDIWLGAARFWPGRYVRQTGFAPPMTWGFLQVTVTL